MIIEVILYKVAKKADLISMIWEMLDRSIIYLSLDICKHTMYYEQGDSSNYLYVIQHEIRAYLLMTFDYTFELRLCK